MGHSLDHSHTSSCSCENHKLKSDRNGAQKILQLFAQISGVQKLINFLSHNMIASIWALIFACMVFIVPFIKSLLPGVGTSVTFQTEIVNTVLITMSYVLTLPPIMYATIDSILALRDVNDNMLMCLAACATIILGCANEGAVLLALFSLSHSLEHKATKKGQKAQKNLLSQMPSTVQRIKKSAFTKDTINLDNLPNIAPLENVQVNENLVIYPNSKIPVDGTVQYGESQVISQYQTGESIPQFVHPGSKLIAGSINSEGLLVMLTTSTPFDSTMANLSNFITNAKRNKPNVQTIIEKATSYWCKIVLLCTLIAFTVLLVLGVPLSGTNGTVYRCLGVLTAGTPCALAVIPLAYTCMISNLVRKRIIVKGGKVLDALWGADVVALDKTGTLTSGTLKLSQVTNLLQQQSTQLLQQQLVNQKYDNYQLSSNFLQQQQFLNDQQLHLSLNITDVFQLVKKLTQGSIHPTAVAIQKNSNKHIFNQQHNQQKIQNGNQIIDSSSQKLNFSRQYSNKQQFLQSVQKPLVMSENAKQTTVGVLQEQQLVSQQENLQFGNSIVTQQILNQNGVQKSNQLLKQVHDVNFINVSQIPGKGVEGKFKFEDEIVYFVRFGSLQFIQEILQNQKYQIDYEQIQSENKISSFLIIWQNQTQQRQNNNQINNQNIGSNLELFYRFDFEDSIPMETKLAVTQLQSNFQHKQLFILSGDKKRNVENIAKFFGIPKFFAQFGPFEKTEKIKSWQQSENKKVVMVGDGINDAAAIAQADVGISLSNSIDSIVSDSSDVIIASDTHLKNLPHLFAAAAFARKIVIQNLVLAFLSILAGVGPILFGLIPLWLAVLVHEGTTLVVALNSLRCLLFNKFYK